MFLLSSDFFQWRSGPSDYGVSITAGNSHIYLLLLLFHGLLPICSHNFPLVASVFTVTFKWFGELPPCNGYFPSSPIRSTQIVALYFYSEFRNLISEGESMTDWELQALFWDAFILGLTVLGLWRQNGAKSTKLWTLLFRQGVIYLVITSAVNLLMLVIFPFITSSP